jgi:hypothetical protein
MNSSRLFGSLAIAVCALALTLTPVRQADAALLFTIDFAGATIYDSSALGGAPALADNGTGVFTFGGNNSYAIFDIATGAFVGTSLTPSGDNATLSIWVQITDNATGAPTEALLSTVTRIVRSSGGGEGNATLVLTTTETEFTQSIGAGFLDSAFAFTANHGASQDAFLSEFLDATGSSVLASVSGTGSSSFDPLVSDFWLRNVTTINQLTANREIRTTGNTTNREVSTTGNITLSSSAIGPFQVVPEPGTLLLLAIGLLGIRLGHRHIRS